jgi:hypothetical protein
MRRHRFIRATILGLALAASAAPAATAQQDLRSPDTRDSALRAPAVTQDLRSPDTRDSALPAPSATQDLRSPDTRDAAVGQSRPAAYFAPFPRTPAAVADTSGAGGSEWTRAGLALAALLLLGGVAVAIRSACSWRPAATLSDGTRDWRRGVGL